MRVGCGGTCSATPCHGGLLLYRLELRSRAQPVWRVQTFLRVRGLQCAVDKGAVYIKNASLVA